MRIDLAALLLALVVAIPAVDTAAIAQEKRMGTVTGRVVDAATGEPLENVNVYLSYTTIGTSSDAQGAYLLRVPEPGAYDLVFSIVGYTPGVRRIDVRRGDTLAIEARLEPALIETDPVEITVEPDAEWEKSLRQFTHIIVGRSEFSEQCTIFNPEVLNFETLGDTFIAAADRPLVVENRALGYRITLLLGEFLWSLSKDHGRYVIYPAFEEMVPENEDDRDEWEENRTFAYRGSIPHFFRSLISGSMSDERFTIYAGPLLELQSGGGHRVAEADFGIEPVDGLPAFTVNFPGYIRIEYAENQGPVNERFEARYRSNAVTRSLHPPPEASMIRMAGASVLVDSSGHLFDPLSIELRGEWALRRIEYLLPRD
jgi:hypothetical protein